MTGKHITHRSYKILANIPSKQLKAEKETTTLDIKCDDIAPISNFRFYLTGDPEGEKIWNDIMKRAYEGAPNVFGPFQIGRPLILNNKIWNSQLVV